MIRDRTAFQEVIYSWPRDAGTGIPTSKGMTGSSSHSCQSCRVNLGFSVCATAQSVATIRGFLGACGVWNVRDRFAVGR